MDLPKRIRYDKPKKTSPIAVGLWASILSWDAWKRSWVGYDPTQSKMTVDRIGATIGIVAWAYLLTT